MRDEVLWSAPLGDRDTLRLIARYGEGAEYISFNIDSRPGRGALRLVLKKFVANELARQIVRFIDPFDRHERDLRGLKDDLASIVSDIQETSRLLDETIKTQWEVAE